MSEAYKAVFLSYASQDAESARLICESLRQSGVEVWFDADGGLEHGDEWDAKIRRQIKECVLFIPVISANTQARLEGYFRLEWELAAQRAMSIASGVQFILPIAIDDTRDADALVPDRFRTVQWTRLPGGVVTPDVRARLLKLWSHRTGALADAASRETTAGFSPAPVPEIAPRANRRLLYAAAVAALTVAVAAVWWFQRVPAPAVDERSVAVLAFKDLSEAKDTEYFSDGISEELLNVFAKVPGLKVSARTSAFSFKGKDTSIPEIALKLGVAYVLEGSVRKSGNQVRITAQLIKAAGGYHVWSQNFDRDLKDIFAVQSEIAESVVEQLRGRIMGSGDAGAAKATARVQVQAAQAKGGTKNAQAYDQYLHGRYYANQFAVENQNKSLAFFRRAIELDPRFALAHSAMAKIYVTRAAGSTNLAETKQNFALAAQNLDRALALEPELADAFGVRAEMLFFGLTDSRAADTALRRALALAPSDPAIHSTAAFIWASLGLVDTGIELARQVMVLDPLNVENRMNLSSCYAVQGRFKEAEVLRREIMALNPSATVAYGLHGAQSMDYVEQGRFDEAVEVAKKEKIDWYRLTMLAIAYLGQGNVAESDRALKELNAIGDNVAIGLAMIYAYRRDRDQAFAWLERAYKNRDTGLMGVRVQPMLDNLRADPRWPVFLRKLGLHDDQLAEFLPDFQKTVFIRPVRK